MSSLTSSSSCSTSPPRVRMAQHRVLLYTTCYNVVDGVTLTCRKLEEELLAQGHSVCVLTTVSGDPKNTHLVPPHPNRRVVFLDNSAPIPFVHDPNNPDLTYQIGFSLSSKVLAEIEAFEPTIIHTTCPDCTSLHLIQYARHKELPILGTYHSNIPEYMDHYPGLSWLKPILAAFFRHQFNFLQALYCPTSFIQQHLTKAYAMDKVTNLRVWGHGVDVNKFHPRHRSLSFRRQLGIGDHEVVVAWCSRLVPEKRPDIFCDTVRRLAERNVPFHALVIGAGPEEEAIRKLPNTTFVGWMDEEQLKVAYASSDMLLFPSAVETFGLVTLEAAASGLPVIVESNCSGHLVRDGVSGYAIMEDDEDAFFEATLDLVVDHHKRQAFSAASRELALSWEKRTILRQMIDNYSIVTDEFYTDFGGRHAHRDEIYRGKPESFVGGSHPRPILLVMVEWLFIMTFQCVWNMTLMFVYIQESVLQRTGLLSLNRSSRNKVVVVAKKQQPLPRIALAKCDEESDDGTVSTADSSSAGDEPSFLSRNQAFGDCSLSHALANSFVNVMLVQCRMESRLRNAVLCRASVQRFSAKRKNSSFAVVTGDNVFRYHRSLDNNEEEGNDSISSSVSLAAGGRGAVAASQPVLRRGRSNHVFDV